MGVSTNVVKPKRARVWNRAERLRRLGLATASIVHDLKNPVTVVKGMADLAAEGTFPKEMVPALRRAAEQMAGMLQDLLDYAGGTGALSLERITARALVEELAGSLTMLESSGIRLDLRVSPGEVLTGDLPKLVRALTNLVNNAREAMPDGGTLTLDIEGAAEAVVVRISDTGKGIPAELLPLIFEPFVSFQKHGGTGLGTTIAKDVVEAHGGRITVASEPGIGTTFEVILPRIAVPLPGRSMT